VGLDRYALDMADASLTGFRARVDLVFMWGLLLFLIAGVLQIFLAGMGVFDINGRRLEDATSFDPHRALGFAMGGAAVILLILAIVVRAGRRTIILSIVLALLTAFMQSLLASAGEDTAFFGGLHALDGLVILGIAGFMHADARRRRVRP
jgi:hypothetical protein